MIVLSVKHPFMGMRRTGEASYCLPAELHLYDKACVFDKCGGFSLYAMAMNAPLLSEMLRRTRGVLSLFFFSFACWSATAASAGPAHLQEYSWLVGYVALTIINSSSYGLLAAFSVIHVWCLLSFIPHFRMFVLWQQEAEVPAVLASAHARPACRADERVKMFSCSKFSPPYRGHFAVIQSTLRKLQRPRVCFVHVHIAWQVLSGVPPSTEPAQAAARNRVRRHRRGRRCVQGHQNNDGEF